MKILSKILKSKFFLIPLVLGVGTFFTVLLGTSDTCYTTEDGDLASTETYGEYEGATQSTACGTDLTLNYIIKQGTSIFWSGFGATIGNVEVENESSLTINGNVDFGGTLKNAGTLKVEAPSAPTAPGTPVSNKLQISAPTGHTSEELTESTFTVSLKNNTLFPAMPAAPTIPDSEFFNITAPQTTEAWTYLGANVPGHTGEAQGKNSTFDVKLKSFPETEIPPSPTIPSSDFFTFTAPDTNNNASGHTEEKGTTTTFTLKLKDSAEIEFPPDPVTPESHHFFEIGEPVSAIAENKGHTTEGGGTSSITISLKNQPEEDITVNVTRRIKHKLYKKIIRRSKKYHAHDENNEFKIGDIVSIVESKPISKLKRWKVLSNVGGGQ